MDAKTQTLQEHADVLRAHAHRNGGSISASEINQWISARKLRDGGGLDERRLLLLAGLAVQIGNGSGYVVVPVTPSLEERQEQQMAEAVTFVREKLSRGPIPIQDMAFPDLKFSAVNFNDVLKAANAARILNAGVSECYALIPPR